MTKGIATIGEILGTKSGTKCRGCNAEIEAGTFYCVPCCSARFCRTCGDEVEVERVRLLNSRTCVSCAKKQDKSANGKRKQVAATRQPIQDDLIPPSAFQSKGHVPGDKYTDGGVQIIDAGWYKRRNLRVPTNVKNGQTGFTSVPHRTSAKRRNTGRVPKGAKRGLDARQWKIYQANKEPLEMIVRDEQ